MASPGGAGLKSRPRLNCLQVHTENTMDTGDKLAATMFSAGAYSALDGHGMDAKASDAFVANVCKEAVARRVRFDEDEEEDTWWNRNKGWALPAAIGAGAFLIGADAGRNGRPDRNYFSNAGSLLWERVKAILGVPNSDLWRSMTKVQRQMSLPLPKEETVSDQFDHIKMLPSIGWRRLERGNLFK